MTKNFNITENPIFRGGGARKNSFFKMGDGVNCQKGAWIVCRFKRGLGEKEKKKG